jgi:predicted 2-oxoglutarate/Fe(II)-dependent dioxygenase YbiX
MNNIYTCKLFEPHEAQRLLDDITSEFYGKFVRSRLYDTSSGNMHFKEIADARRSWEQVYHNHTRFAWIKARLNNHVRTALDQFGLTMPAIHYPQGLRFLKYDSAETGFQNWHTDKSKQSRILTCVVQLTDPDEYQGARLEFQSPILSKQVPVQQGSLIIFPSEQIHRVSECISGIRYSLIVWAETEDTALPPGYTDDTTEKN